MVSFLKIFLVLGIISLSVIDVFLNSLGLIPYLGGILESISEIGIEIIQVILVGLLALLED